MLYRIIIIMLINHTIAFSNYCILESLEIDSKINGIIVSLNFDSLPHEDNLSGWQAKNGWFYITLYQCKAPLNKKILKKVHSDIAEWEIIENKESLQLGIKPGESIGQFNFALNPSKISVIASLHFLSKTFATKLSDNENHNFGVKNGLSNGTKTWLNSTGVWLTLSGLLREKSVATSPSALTGISIIISTFIIDTILKDF